MKRLHLTERRFATTQVIFLCKRQARKLLLFLNVKRVYLAEARHWRSCSPGGCWCHEGWRSSPSDPHQHLESGREWWHLDFSPLPAASLGQRSTCPLQQDNMFLCTFSCLQQNAASETICYFVLSLVSSKILPARQYVTLYFLWSPIEFGQLCSCDNWSWR